MKETNPDFFNNAIKSISKVETISDGTQSPGPRSDKNSAILDYVVLPNGNGKYKVSPERCKEVGISMKEAAELFVQMKTNDIIDVF